MHQDDTAADLLDPLEASCGALVGTVATPPEFPIPRRDIPVDRANIVPEAPTAVQDLRDDRAVLVDIRARGDLLTPVAIWCAHEGNRAWHRIANESIGTI